MSVWSNYDHTRLFPDEDCLRFLSSLQDEYHDSQIQVCDFGVGNGRSGQGIKHFFPNSRLMAIDKFLDGFKNSSFQSFYDEVREDLHGLKVDVVLDVMTSQHFPWSEHDEYFQLVADALNPGGWFFLKHLNHDCSDAKLIEPIDNARMTFKNIPNLPAACFPDNGITAMPFHRVLLTALQENGLPPFRAYRVIREEDEKVFAHSVFFCQKERTL